MHLFNLGDTVAHKSSGSSSKFRRYLTHEKEPLDFYLKYNHGGFIPKKGASNPQNLFDDSDVKDSYWLSIAKEYITMSRF